MKFRIRRAGGLALLLAPLIHAPVSAQDGPTDTPPPVTAGLEDLVSGRTESDATNTDDDTRTLSCSVENDKGSVEFSLAPAPSGACRWIVRQGEVWIESGTLDVSNGWKATCDGLAPGLYSLEVTARDGGNFRRKIDFLTGSGNAKDAEKSRKALDLHAAKDYPGLMKALGKLDPGAASVPPQMRAELAWARIDGLLFYRKFEDILPAIEAFKREHPASARSGAVAEAEMAARFERGLKKTLESVEFQNAKSGERRAEGVADLQRFISLASSRSAENYAAVPKRDLRQDLWAARIILGGEEAALKEIPAGDAAGREKFHLLCALLHPKIHPEQAEQNIQRMKGFLKDYPKSTARPRVELDLADVALREGERLITKVGLPAEAALHFEFAHELFSRVVENKDAGISVTDVEQSWEGIMRVHYWQVDGNWQRDDAKLLAWLERMVSMSAPGSNPWRQAKLFQGLVLKDLQKYDEAAVVLDELVALGFKGNPSHDGRTSAAVRARIDVAWRVGDEDKQWQLKQWVRESNCVDSIRRGYGKGESTEQSQ